MQNLLLVDQSELERLIRREVDELKRAITQSPKTTTDEWIRSCYVPAYLGVSRRTWQKYRKARLTPYSQRGRIITVKRSDLDAFLEAHTVKPKRS